MGTLLSNPDDNKGARNNLKLKKLLSAMHKRTIKNPDGTTNVKGKSITHNDNKLMEGDGWLFNPFRINVDAPDVHFRRDEKSTEIKEFTTFIDEFGREITDEKQVLMEDVFETKGIKLIGNAPEIDTDGRLKMLDDFAKDNTDAFKMLTSDQRIILLEDMED